MKYFPLVLIAGAGVALWYFWPDLSAGRNKTQTDLAAALKRGDDLQVQLDAAVKAQQPATDTTKT
jgi:hypothetical protein